MSKTVYNLLQKINLNRVRARGISTQISAALYNKDGITHTGQVVFTIPQCSYYYANKSILLFFRFTMRKITEMFVLLMQQDL